MSKSSAAALGLTVFVAALCIASLVFSILIYDKVHKDKKKEEPTTQAPPVTQATSPLSPETTPRSSASPLSTSPPPPLSTSPRPTFSTLIPPTERPQPSYNETVFCPRYGIAEDTPESRRAAALILSGLDENVDPCDDFYAFTCNKYIRDHDVKELGVGKISASGELQEEINMDIVNSLSDVDVMDDVKWSKTEIITKALLESCVYHATTKGKNNTLEFLYEVNSLFGGIPFIGHSVKDGYDIFDAMGRLEQNHALSSLMGAMVTVDYKNISQHALYISQPKLPMPRDYYVLPQFSNKLAEREQLIFHVMRTLADEILDDHEKYLDLMKEAARDVAKLEMNIAMASLPGSQLRNYAQQHNAYTRVELRNVYPAIDWYRYLSALLSGISYSYSDLDYTRKLIITQPSYFGWLNAVFAGEIFQRKTLINYMITQLIFEDADFLGGEYKAAAIKGNYVPYVQRKGFGVTRVGGRIVRAKDSSNPNLSCLNLISSYMPFGPGYVYVKSKGDERLNVRKDVSEQTDRLLESFLEMMSELEWMTARSKNKAQEKAKAMTKSYGWPDDLFGDFTSSSTIDAYHKQDYEEIIDIFRKNSTYSYYRLRNIMIKGYSNRESLRLLKEEPKRTRFMLSPAIVNAFYQPETNSITLPYANFNPPYYNYGQAQAYNYAGEHAIAAHELVHGFDDEGVQFGADGSLSNCGWNECGWMDRQSKDGFKDMAQCVISQYSTQCCPEKSGMIQCANGATTQGENIADLGGVQAAYRAYQMYAKSLGKQEKRLPGLEQYSPNQLFWIANGFGWCENRSEENMISQLLTNVHSPGMCRVNQVVQDIPAFAKDFGCKMGQKMYPEPEERCSVWVRE